MRSIAKPACVFSLLMLSAVHGQETAVQPASHVAHAAPVGRGIRFGLPMTAVGERVVQRIGMELNIHTVVKQSGKVAHDGQTNMRSRQEREIEVLEIAHGKAVRAQVKYPLSRSLSPENPDPGDEIAQSVEGKSYLITRKNERLLVTDLDGAIPPRNEYDIVVSTMESFGQPNLLAEFLVPRELQIGERLQVPADIAKKMLGFDSFGEVQKFELYLEEIKEIDGSECAIFVADIVAQGNEQNPLNVQARGNVVIELATCRTLEATLTGPISLVSVEQQTEYSARGDLLLAIRSQYAARK
jgi:hypothetical protein